MTELAIVTCLDIPEPDPDEALLMRALADAGIDATLAAWDDPDFRPGNYETCVLRSCWNYFERPAEFVEWVGEADTVTRLANPASIVRWNHHKAYLEDLADKGVPIVPTAWVDKGDSEELEAIMERRNWERVVVKPAVSAGSYRTRSFTRNQVGDGQRFLDDLCETRDAMVQKYMDEVDRSGEVCIVCIDGQLTHAVRKEPRFADGVERVSRALRVTEDQRALANETLACVDERLLYARIDIIADPGGDWLLSELELIEPSLFFKQSDAALAAFIAALNHWRAR